MEKKIEFYNDNCSANVILRIRKHTEKGIRLFENDNKKNMKFKTFKHYEETSR